MYYILPDNSVVAILLVILRPLMSIPYIPLRPTIQKVPGSIPVNVYGDEIESKGIPEPNSFSHSLRQ